MNAVHEDLIRAAVALQVATLEHIAGQNSYERRKAWRAMKECLDRANETVAALRRFKDTEAA